MMRRMTPREAMRLMRRMGVEVEEIEDVRQVIIRTASKQIVIDDPSVTTMKTQGHMMFQVAGGSAREETIAETKALSISDDDVKLVAQQANVGLEEAKEALERAGGDLARAILLLQEKKS